MRIAIDAFPLLLRSAGVKTYIFNWIRNLRSLVGESNVLAFPSIGRLEEYSHEKSVLGPAATFARLAWYHAVNYSGLPLVDWLGVRVDVFHAPHMLWNAPRRTRLTATLYDLTCWLSPETHPRGNVTVMKRFADRVLCRAAGLIAISESTRNDAVRVLGLPEDHIEVIYPGVAGGFFQVTPAAVAAVRAKYRLTRPYLLFVGTIEPRKNIDTLLKAYARLKPSLRQEFGLVLAGPIGWAARETIERVRRPAAGVSYLGYVPEADLPGVTAVAAAFVYPSLYEGFGLPLAQAMAAGVPAITSGVSSMPEVAGGAALLVDPRSDAELTEAMETLLLSENLQRRLTETGQARARRFTWESCAAASLAFFQRVCGTTRR